MDIRIVSDLHLLWSEYLPPPMVGDSDKVLVLAGDIAEITHIRRYKGFFEYVNNHFKAVIYVAGNHEYYGSDIVEGDDMIRKFLLDNHFYNIHYLQDEVVVIDNVVFAGSTLWTEPRDEIEELAVGVSLNDFRYIRHADRVFTINDSITIHRNSVKFLNEVIDAYPNKEVVIVTHHAPSFLSSAPRWLGSAINGGFATALDDIVRKSGAVVWIHGHMHDNARYMIGDTEVICNPRGYSRRALSAPSFSKMFDKLVPFDPDSPQVNPSFDILDAQYEARENLLFDPYLVKSI